MHTRNPHNMLFTFRQFQWAVIKIIYRQIIGSPVKLTVCVNCNQNFLICPNRSWNSTGKLNIPFILTYGTKCGSRHIENGAILFANGCKLQRMWSVEKTNHKATRLNKKRRRIEFYRRDFLDQRAATATYADRHIHLQTFAHRQIKYYRNELLQNSAKSARGHEVIAHSHLISFFQNVFF